MVYRDRVKAWLSRGIAIVAGLAVLLLVLLGVLHTAPARDLVLRRVALVLADRFDLALDAASLRYNVVTGRVTLSRVTLAATHTPGDPFLTADSIDVTVPLVAVFGDLAFERIRLENARLAIRRHADGSSNLPLSESSEEGGPPSAINIGRLEVPQLAIAFEDKVSGVSLLLPAISVDVGRQTGDLRLTQPGRVARESASGTDATTIKELGGGTTFDGRAVHVSRFIAVTDEAEVTLDGEIAVLVSEPHLDLNVSGRGDVSGLARWATSDAPRSPTGSLTVEATVTGRLSSPAITSHLRSDSIAYSRFTFSNVDAHLTVDGGRLEARRVELSLANGRVVADGRLMFESSDASVAASWSDLDVEQLGRMLTGSRSTMPAGRATGEASFAGVVADAATWSVELSNRIVNAGGSAGARGRARLPVDGEASLRVAESRWQLEGTHRVAEASLHTSLGGNVDPNDLAKSALTGTVEARDADVSRVIASLETAGLLDTIPAVAGQLEVVASLSGSLAQPAFHLVASAERLSAFDVHDLSVDAKATGNLDRAVVDARVQQGVANALLIDGMVWPREARLDARVGGTLGDLSTLQPDVPLAGTADVRFDASGPFQAIVARGAIAVTDARYDKALLGPLEAQIALDAGVARVDLSAPDLGAEAHASLRIGGSRSGVVDVQVRDAQLERLVTAADLDADLSGTLSLTGHAEGALDNWRRAVAAIEISALEGRSGALPIRLRETARVWYDRGTLDVVSFEAALGETQLSIGGRYAVLDEAAGVAPSDALRATLLGDVSHIIDLVRASGLVETLDVTGTGPVTVLARVNGAGMRPLVSADIELGPAQVATQDLPPLHRLQVRARIADGWAEVVSASGDWQQAGINVRGRVPLTLLADRVPDGLFASTDTLAEPAWIDLRAVAVTSQALAPFLPPESVAQIDGALDATVHLEASSLEWASVQGEAELNRLELSVAGVSVTQQQPTRIEIEKGIARVTSWNWTGRGTSLVVQGEVRLPEQRAAVLAGGQIDLRLLTPFLPSTDMSVGGALAPSVSVSGPLSDLRIEGDVTVADGELRMRDPDVIVTGVTATASLGRDQVRITSLDGQVNGGSLKGAGDLTYGGDNRLSGSMGATISGMGLDYPRGLRSEVDADLTLDVASSDESLGGTLSGTVTVVRSAYRENIAVLNQLLTALRTERLAAAVSTEETFANRLRLNVRVLTDSDIVVDNNLARLELGGDLRLIGTAAAPALSGRATLREGGELFIGNNRFTIESGSIDFANPITIEPNLDIRAHTRAGGEDIELTLTGTPETASVDLQSPSDPQLGQADIASLLLTGRSLNEVSGDEAEIVGEQVLGYLSGDVLGVASRVVGLDTIRLGGLDPTLRRRDSAEIASESDPTSRLTFGKSLGDTFDITLSQSLRESGEQTWIVDYTPIPQIGLRYVQDDENLRSYEFRHDVTIGDRSTRSRSVPRPVRVLRRVTAVMLVGELGGPEERLRRVIDVAPGDEFDFSAWQRDRDRLERALHEEGRLEARVSARREDAGAGVAVTYSIEAGPLTSIRVTGFDVPQDAIREIEIAWTRSIFDEALVEEVQDIVRRALTERGYVQPLLKASLMTVDGGKTLELIVEPGARASERRLIVMADDEVMSRDIEEWARSSQSEPLAWRDPATFQRALVEELRRRGHVAPEVAVAAPQADGASAVVRVDVRAGPFVTVSDVRIDAGVSVPADRLRTAAGIEPGAPYDPTAVDRARERVARLMRAEGFADARVDARAEKAPDGGQVAVIFLVDEGPRQVLREIVVNGNRSIDRDVIIRALDLEIGDPIGADAWLRARARLFDTSLFRRVDVTAEPVDAASDGQQPMRLMVTAEEWPALRLRYGLQVTEDRPEDDVEGRDLTPGLSADITRRTLFGRAITVGGVFEYQRRERLARGFLNAQSMLGLPVESLLSVERSREDIPEASVVTDRSGVSWEQRVQIGGPLRVSYGYRFDRDHTFSTRESDDPLNPTFDVTVNLARLTGSVVFDTRNNPLDTRRGLLVSSSFEYAPASLGSDIRFVRYLGQAYRFQPWRSVVLASAARIGLATALAGQELIPSERFFAGGARTVRGVLENTLGPRDFFGDAAGGGALVLFNQEARFPIFRWFNGVGFVDVGNVFERPGSIDFSDLVGSFGAGLRVATPFALLRADVARLWSPEDGQPTARWTFGIGHTF